MNLKRPFLAVMYQNQISRRLSVTLLIQFYDIHQRPIQQPQLMTMTTTTLTSVDFAASLIKFWCTGCKFGGIVNFSVGFSNFELLEVLLIFGDWDACRLIFWFIFGCSNLKETNLNDGIRIRRVENALDDSVQYVLGVERL